MKHFSTIFTAFDGSPVATRCSLVFTRVSVTPLRMVTLTNKNFIGVSACVSVQAVEVGTCLISTWLESKVMITPVCVTIACVVLVGRCLQYHSTVMFGPFHLVCENSDADLLASYRVVSENTQFVEITLWGN